MPYTKTALPDSSNSEGGGLLINDSADVVWQAGSPLQIYLYRSQNSVTEKISNNLVATRGSICALNNDCKVVWDTYISDQYGIYYFDGTAVSRIDPGGQGSEMPDINADGTIAFVRYGFWSDAFEVQIDLCKNMVFTRRLVGWPGSQYAINLRINNSNQIAYALYNGQTRTYALHLLSGGVDKTIGSSYQSVNDLAINSSGWVVWAAEGPACRDIYLYNGVETKKINAPGSAAYAPALNNQGRVVYYSGDCDKMDIYLYSQGSTSCISTGIQYNYDPQINDSNEIVWWGGSQWSSPATSNIYYSANGAQWQEIALSGARPKINNMGQTVYWDANANQLFLLTPMSPFYWLRYFLRLVNIVKKLFS